ncbi:acyltransferase family protein [Lacticaseibacillus kribbianus]|uniref:acyltransferase family protein n=1 Tax=Lacticaseibacillus kribbianus TaxID=2926292 RepID=UPI001CD4F923|nr:acyltransferase family protein [Lacticaseibacillus kribbianus]
MVSTHARKHQRINWFSLVRITGLILVLTYHFYPDALAGGFIGVDVFFAFSGFLITSLMIDEFASSQDFDLLGFYRRRFYRIVPPLVLSVLVVLPLTLLVSPDFRAGIGQQVTAALGFVTNYFEIATGGSYETKFIPHLFVHTWSLAVEMHFYVLWGAFVFLLARFVRHFGGRPSALTVSFRMGLALFALVFGGGSILLMNLQAAGLTEFSPVYFSSLTHGFPFFIGALLATLTGITARPYWFEALGRRANAWWPALLMLAAAAGLFGLGRWLRFDQLSTYQYGMLLAVGLACVMIFAARVLHEATLGATEPWLVSFLADTSYSMYLYHWPLFVIFSHLMPTWQAVLVTIGLGLVLSSLSYYVIEPIIAGRAAKIGPWRPRGWVLGVPIALLALALSGIGVWTVRDAPRQTALQATLEVGGLYQDQDQLGAARSQILAVSAPKPKAKPAATAPAKPAPKVTDYRAYNQKSTAEKHDIPAGVSVIGDSVTLGTRQYLGAHVAESTVDAEGDRTMNLAYNVMMAAQKANTLREFVVIAIGTNALDDYAAQTAKVIKDLAPGHKLVFMTPYNREAGPDWNSTKLGELERKLPDKYDWITIADWGQVAPTHPKLFEGTDGVHFAGRREGDILFAQLVNSALIQAAKRPAKK